MPEILRVTVPGDPIPKGRPRTGRGNVYTPQRTVDAEDRMRTLMRVAYGPLRPQDGPVGIEVTFYCATRRRTDGDNLLKLVTDALQRGRRVSGGVIWDDDQILEWKATIRRRQEGQVPRTEILVYTVEE